MKKIIGLLIFGILVFSGISNIVISKENQSIDIIGKALDQAIVDYLNMIGGMNTNALHRNTIEGWILMGDPSLKIGGYEKE